MHIPRNSPERRPPRTSKPLTTALSNPKDQRRDGCRNSPEGDSRRRKDVQRFFQSFESGELLLLLIRCDSQDDSSKFHDQIKRPKVYTYPCPVPALNVQINTLNSQQGVVTGEVTLCVSDSQLSSALDGSLHHAQSGKNMVLRRLSMRERRSRGNPVIHG